MNVSILLVTIIQLFLFCGPAISYYQEVRKVSFPIEKCTTNDIPPSEIPTYVINLDEDPRLRWSSIVHDYVQELRKIRDFIPNLMGKTVYKLFMIAAGIVSKRFSPEYMGEINGIAVASGLEPNDVVLFNIFNEFFSLCTSIVARDIDSKMFHGRNLDFGLFMGWNKKNHTWELTNLLRDIMVKIVWQKDGQTVAESVNFVGYIGIVTGMKPFAYSVSLNDRFSIDGGFIGLIKYLFHLPVGKFASLLIREKLLSNEIYESVFADFRQEELVAPAYIILSNATYKGSVVTRSRTKDINDWELSENMNDWYLVQTNYDNWKKPPFFDDRVTPSNTCLDYLIHFDELSEGMLYNVLRTKPVRNKLTVYTAIMIPSEGYLKAYKQYCEDPCPLW